MPPEPPADGTADLLCVGALATVVRSRRPVDERERWSVALFLATLDELIDPFGERPGPGAADRGGRHVTVSALVTGPRGVVLHRHKRLGIWLQPGGHVDPGESPAQAALREAEEETGMAVRHAGGLPCLVHVDVHPGPRCDAHLDLRFLLVADDVEPAPGEGESQDVAWFGWEEAMTVADGGLIGALVAARGELDGGGDVTREDAGGRQAPP